MIASEKIRLSIVGRGCHWFGQVSPFQSAHVGENREAVMAILLHVAAAAMVHVVASPTELKRLPRAVKMFHDPDVQRFDFAIGEVSQTPRRIGLELLELRTAAARSLTVASLRHLSSWVPE